MNCDVYLFLFDHIHGEVDLSKTMLSCLMCLYSLHTYVLPCVCFDIILPRSALCRGSLMFIFPSMCIHLNSFSNHFVCFPTNNCKLNLDSTLNITEVCLPICSKPPCANMCEYNQHAEQYSDDFVNPIPARYIANVNQFHVELSVTIMFYRIVSLVKLSQDLFWLGNGRVSSRCKVHGNQAFRTQLN